MTVWQRLRYGGPRISPRFARDGRICWNDGAARKGHRTELLREIVVREIRGAL